MHFTGNIQSNISLIKRIFIIMLLKFTDRIFLLDVFSNKIHYLMHSIASSPKDTVIQVRQIFRKCFTYYRYQFNHWKIICEFWLKALDNLEHFFKVGSYLQIAGRRATTLCQMVNILQRFQASDVKLVPRRRQQPGTSEGGFIWRRLNLSPLHSNNYYIQG